MTQMSLYWSPRVSVAAEGMVAFEKADRIGFQRRFRIEKGVGGRRIDGVFVEEALARGQEGQSGDYRYLVQYGFHGIAC
ncbi:MAG: hypothetical protein ACLUYV_03660 [Alistipes shahii]